MNKINLLLIILFIQANIYSQHICVFVGSYNWDKTAEGIYVYELDTVTGNLTKLTSYAGVANPSFLTISKDGKFVYACTETKTPKAGSVSSFEFNYQQKSLTFLNNQPSHGENPVYIALHQNGKWLVDGNYTEASVSVYPLLPDGRIDSIAQSIVFSGKSIHKTRQDASHIHSTVFSPDCSSLFLADLGSDKIWRCKYTTEDKSPLHADYTQFINTVPGSGPRHMTFHPGGQFLYCIGELSGTIDVYLIERFYTKVIQRVNTHPDELTEGFESSDIHVSPDGKFLYASNRGKENNIAIFSIESNGSLKTIGYQSTLGEHPRIFAIDPSGNFLIVSNVHTGNIVVFRRNKTTGLLTNIGEEKGIKNPSCVRIVVY